MFCSFSLYHAIQKGKQGADLSVHRCVLRYANPPLHSCLIFTNPNESTIDCGSTLSSLSRLSPQRLTRHESIDLLEQEPLFPLSIFAKTIFVLLCPLATWSILSGTEFVSATMLFCFQGFHLIKLTLRHHDCHQATSFEPFASPDNTIHSLQSSATIPRLFYDFDGCFDQYCLKEKCPAIKSLLLIHNFIRSGPCSMLGCKSFMTQASSTADVSLYAT